MANTTSGEKMYSSLLTQFVREDVPGTYNPASGARFVMTQVKGEFVPEEQWANFRPDGFNEDAWNALSKTHQMFSGTFQPDFSHIEILMEMCCGVKNFAQTAPAAGVVQYVYEPPAVGSRDIYTYSIERGTPDNCDVSTYGILVSLSMESDRDAASISGAFSLLARKPAADKIGVAMSGAIAQNHKTRVTAANVAGALGLSIMAPGLAAQAVSIAIGDTAAQIVTKFGAQGLTVTASGTIATGSGKSQSITGSGNALSIGGVAVDLTTPESVATLVGRIKAANPSRTTLTGTGTITAAVAGTVAAYRFSGAGDTTYNGDYVPSGANNGGKPIYQLANLVNGNYVIVTGGAARVLSWNISGWWDLNAALGNSPYYRSNSGATLPDSSANYTVGGGIFPAPTATAVSGGGGTPASVNITLTDDAAAGNKADLPVTGTGYNSVATAPGSAGGVIDLEFTAPGNALISVSKSSGDAGYVLSTTQAGSDGKLRIPKRLPLLPQMMSFRQADTRAGLDTASPFSKCKLIRFAYDALVTAEWFADENNLTFQTHTDGADPKRTMGVKIAKSSAQLAQMQADAAASPSIARYNECRWAHPDGKHLVRSIMLASVSGVAPIKAAGNIQAYEFPLSTVLSDTPFSENSAALVIRKAA